MIGLSAHLAQGLHSSELELIQADETCVMSLFGHVQIELKSTMSIRRSNNSHSQICAGLRLTMPPISS